MTGTNLRRDQSGCYFLTAYSVGHRKSQKSSENGRLRREKSQSPKEALELVDCGEKDTKRICILKVLGIGEFAERMPKECTL